jgi:hypothetical protein
MKETGWGLLNWGSETAWEVTSTKNQREAEQFTGTPPGIEHTGETGGRDHGESLGPHQAGSQ